MRRAIWLMVFLCSATVLGRERTVATVLTRVAGPSASIREVLPSRQKIRPEVIIEGSSQPTFFVGAAIYASGKNNTFFHTDFFLTNNRDVPQEVLIFWLPEGQPGGTSAGSRFSLNANSVYLLEDFLAPGPGNLDQTGVGALYVAGVFSGSNSVDSDALLEGSDRIWTFEPGSSGTNSFTLDSQFGDVTDTFVATSAGLKQNQNFRTNIGIVNFDSNFAHIWTVRVTGTGQSTSFNVTVPALSMQLVAVPASFTPGSFFAEFTPDANMAGEVWGAYGVSADNLTGDSWVARASQQ